MTVRLLTSTPDPERHIEYCARVCYESGDRIGDNTYAKMLTALLKNGHHSLFEHSSASFIIEDISRAASHQLVRHRLATYSQKSQRYVKENAFEYATPPDIAANPEAEKIYASAMEALQKTYDKLTALGMKKEDARFVLPNAACTTITMTSNFREWLHIIDLRVSPHAQWEIREMMTAVWKELYRIAPIVFGLTYFEHWGESFEFKKQVFEDGIAGA